MNKRLIPALIALALPALAQAQPGADSFTTGQSLRTINEAGQETLMSDNVQVFGSFHFSESCTFDPERNLILAMNAGAPQNVQPNDGYVSLISPDGAVHASKWIGASREGLTLNHPLGSAISNNVLYVADMTTVRGFDLQTGRPIDTVEVPGATGLNGIAVDEEGTVYVSNTRDPQQVFRIGTDGNPSVFVEGAPLAAPNGVAIDNEGNIVVVNIGNNEVLTFNRQGRLVNTEHAQEGGNDGIVITDDGTKYVSSVRFGSISRIRPGRPAEIIAEGIPSAASMCYDSNQNQLVVPMNAHNALAFVPLD